MRLYPRLDQRCHLGFAEGKLELFTLDGYRRNRMLPATNFHARKGCGGLSLAVIPPGAFVYEVQILPVRAENIAHEIILEGHLPGNVSRRRVVRLALPSWIGVGIPVNAREGSRSQKFPTICVHELWPRVVE